MSLTGLATSQLQPNSLDIDQNELCHSSDGCQEAFEDKRIQGLSFINEEE